MKIPEDPFIQELLPEFVESWLNDLDTQFFNLIETKNEADLYRMAHTLKGSCFQFGLDEIAELGVELMGVARSKDWEKARTYFEPLRKGFVEMQEHLNKNLN